MSKRQYFIAILPDSERQQQITSIKEYVRDRYDSSAALKSPPHITLHPPFHWDEEHEDQITKVLSSFCAQHSGLSISMNGYNSFAPRVIYVDVEPNDALQQLYFILEDYLDEHLNVSNKLRKGRQFNPHMTVAFSDLNKEQFYLAWREFKEKEIQFTFFANELTLLKHDGKCWQTLRNFLLCTTNPSN